MTPQLRISVGNRWPFDGSDKWWANSNLPAAAPKDWAHSAARGIIEALQDRSGIKHELREQNIEEETRREIVEEIAEIIRAAKGMRPPSKASRKNK